MSSRNKNSRKKGVKRSLDFGDNNNDDNDENKKTVDLISSNDDTTATTTTTPKKKTKKRDLTDFFASPTTTTASRPSSIAVVTPPDVKLKESTTKVVPPKKKKKRTDGYVPTYIHKNVGYVKEGETELDPTTRKVFELVDEHYVIPQGFENNRQYGPLSGVSFEQRAIAAYCNNLLEPKGGEVQICTQCAAEGHKRDDCPTLL